MLIMVKFSHRSVLFISSTELFSRPDYITLHVLEQVFALYSLVLSSSYRSYWLLLVWPVPLQVFSLFLSPIARMQGRVTGMGGLEAGDPLQFIPPPTDVEDGGFLAGLC